MRQRLISAIILLIICLPLIYIGDIWFLIGLSLVGILGLKEITNLYKKNFNIAVEILSYISIIALIFGGNSFLTLEKSICITFLLLFLPIIFYNKKIYNFNDAIEIFVPVLFLGISFNFLGKIRMEDIYVFIFVIMIPILCDIFAYLVGNFFGKMKFIPNISPNKTIEGTISGTLVSVIGASIYYIFNVDPSVNIFLLLIDVFILSILGQLGDLFFSSIKRYYGVKDYSNLLPGHGGVLDRFDSMIFVVLGFIILFN